MYSNFTSRITGYSSTIAGALHLSVVAILHWTPFPPLESVFFFFGGIIQIAIGMRFLTRPTISLYHKGLWLNGGMALMYVLMLFLPVPFVGEPEAVEGLGLLVLGIELLAVSASLTWILTHETHSKEINASISFAVAAVVMLLSGFGMYGGAHTVASVLPDRQVEHSHDDSHPHVDADSTFSHTGSTMKHPMKENPKGHQAEDENPMEDPHEDNGHGHDDSESGHS